MATPFEVLWPEHYHPRHCPVHVRNALDMAAPPENVWAWLCHATHWPTWYTNSAKVQLLAGAGSTLQQGTQFRWHTFGVNITSTVLEFVPKERIAWDAHGVGVEAYHAWVLQPSARGCHVLTEETQHGWLARLGSRVMPKRMYQFHQLWLEGLAAKAKGGLPPGL